MPSQAKYNWFNNHIPFLCPSHCVCYRKPRKYLHIRDYFSPFVIQKLEKLWCLKHDWKSPCKKSLHFDNELRPYFCNHALWSFLLWYKPLNSLHLRCQLDTCEIWLKNWNKLRDWSIRNQAGSKLLLIRTKIHVLIILWDKIWAK